MAKNLFVTGLAYSVTEDQLNTLFSQAGTVSSAKIIIDHDSGQSKGFGFVEMTNDADADTAVDSMNNTDFQGRKLTVSPARPQEARF